MKSHIVTILIIFLAFTNVGAQTKVTKDEILISWTFSENKTRTIKDFKNFTFNSKINDRTSIVIDSLHHRGIDSIIIYSVAYPGYSSSDPCFEYFYPVYCYLLWTTKEKLNIKTIRGKCESDTSIVDSLDLSNYYRINKGLIEKENVMPVIIEAQRSKKNKISYTMTSIDHEPKYSIYFLFGNKYTTVNFAQDDIQNQESLFHEHNQALKTVKVWGLIKKEIGSNQE